MINYKSYVGPEENEWTPKFGPGIKLISHL